MFNIMSRNLASISNSKQWIQRQLSDRYVRKAQELNFRSRAAFKLIQIDDQFSFLRPTSTVVDLGCFSGGWSQVALSRCINGTVIGVDKVRMDSLPNHTFIQGDITELETVNAVINALDGKPVDVVISDMAPAITGHKLDDHDSSIELSLIASEFVDKVLCKGGWFVIKSFYGPKSSEFVLFLKSKFKLVRTVKPKASRSESSEIYYVCANYRGGPGKGLAGEVPIDGGLQTPKHTI
jgi:23S rRNA (uridine2552-2'-O)-methyltransferase